MPFTNWTNDFRAGHIQTDGAQTEVLTTITRLRIAANSNVLKEQTSGSAYGQAAHLVAVTPVANITLLTLNEAFKHLGGSGRCTTATNLFGQKQDCSGVVSGSTHNQYAITKGCIVPTTLTCDHQGNAELNYDIYAASPDGTADPIVKSQTTMPVSTESNTNNRFEMWDATVGGNTLTGKRNISINWNPTVTQEGADSNIWPTTVTLTSVQPTITIRGVDPDWLNSLGLSGERGTIAATNTRIRFRNRNYDTGPSDLEHVSIACDCQISWNTLFDAGPDAPGECELQIDAYSPDPDVEPLEITTDVALT